MNDAAVNELLDVIAQRIGPRAPCPFCGHTEWRSLGAMYFILPPGELTDSGEQAFSQGVVGAFCTNCTFVRLHNALPQDE